MVWHKTVNCITVHLSDCFVVDCGVVSCSSCFILSKSRMLSLTLPMATSSEKNHVEHEFNGEDSTQIFTTISVLSFSNVIEYPFIFKCEVYCRGILNFSCDAFNRTLCALITLLLICCVYWCPFCVIAIWLLVLFFFWAV